MDKNEATSENTTNENEKSKLSELIEDAILPQQILQQIPGCEHTSIENVNVWMNGKTQARSKLRTKTLK